MSQEFQEHWLSAYLDNELSTDERALVERRLEEDPEARELLEDLKRVRGLVATLPGWQGQDFRFDMSRLNAPSSADNLNEEDVEEEFEDEPAPGVSRINRTGSMNGMGLAKWRGLLAMAAGLLVLALCLPFAYRQWSTMAMREVIGGNTGDTSNSIDAIEAKGNADFAPASPANIRRGLGQAPEGLEDMGLEDMASSQTGLSAGAGGGMPGSMGGGMGGGMGGMGGMGAGVDDSRRSLPDLARVLPEAMPMAPAAPAPAMAPSDLALGARTAEPPSSPAPPRNFADNVPSRGNESVASRSRLDSPKENAAADKALPDPRNLDPNHVARQNANMNLNDQPSVKAKAALESAAKPQDSPSVAADRRFDSESTEPVLLVANSKAWSREEIDRELVKLQAVPSSLLPTKDNIAAGTEVSGQPRPDQMPAKTPDQIVLPLPTSSTVTQWFEQIQNVQPLAPMDAPLNRFSLVPPLGKDMLPRSQSVESFGATAQPELQKELKRENPEVQDMPGRAAPSMEQRSAGNEQKQRSGGTAPVRSSKIILFVSEAEAQKIIQSIQGSEGKYWRVVPANEGSPSDKAGDNKVVLILNGSPN